MISPTLLLLAASPCLAMTDPVSETGHEPNQTRDTATPAAIANGGGFTGISRGFIDDPASTADTTRDIWRVTITANPAVIQCHTLQLSTSGTQGHTGSIMGVSATAGVIDPASMATLQNTSINTVPARFCQVYTLGQAAPTFLYRLTGSAGTSAPYLVSLNSQTVVPTQVRPSCPFVAGMVKITTVGRTTANTKLFLFNGDTLAPIDGGVNDDTPPSTDLASGSSQSTLVRTLQAGRYVLAIATTDTVDNRLPPADDRYANLGFSNLTECPGLLVSGSSSATGDFSFSIYDSTMYTVGASGGAPVPAPLNVSAAKPGAYGIAFFTFTVASRCSAADLGTTGAVACADNALDNNDFIVFIDQFFRHSLTADVGVAGGLPGSDQLWDNNDWIAYLTLFFSGC